jgi:hypothetical protein
LFQNKTFEEYSNLEYVFFVKMKLFTII